jgi:hypothetical protein
MNARSPRTRRWLVAAAIGAVLVVAGGVVAGIIANKDADSDAASTQGRSGFAADEPTFSTLGELVRHADLVVVGTVAQVEPGKILEAENPDEPARELNTDIRVEHVVKGSTSSSVVTVATLDLAYGGAEGDSRRDWREPGVRVVAFISQSPEGGSLYIPTYVPELGPSYSQSFFIADGEKLTAAVQAPDLPLNGQIEKMSLTTLRESVRTAASGGG